jgi:hypothetical protein
MLQQDWCLIVDQVLKQVVLEAALAPSGLLVVALNITVPVDHLPIEHTYMTQEEAPDINKLHCPFGHVGEAKVHTLAKWLRLSLMGQALNQCNMCIHKKQKWLPICLGPAPHTHQPMEVLHLDLSGPISPPTHTSCQYYLAIINSYSCWLKTYLLHTKDTAVNTIWHFLAATLTNKWCCHIITDQGGEFISLITQELFHTASIIHNTTPAHTPEYNSLVEQFNQTIMNSIQTWCSQKGDSVSFSLTWDKCVQMSGLKSTAECT